jgi:DNA primase
MTATAYERIVDKLAEMDLRVRPGARSATALCPSHDDRNASLAVYDRDGKAKIVCFAGCDDALDILPVLDMTVADLYDEKRSGKPTRPSPEVLAWAERAEARKSMTPSQKAADNLFHIADMGERICLAIARVRPELYLWEREQLGSDASDASHASDQNTGGGSGE